MDTMERLTQWYASHCNGSWENDCGIEIGTLDSPGWTVSIDLVGTGLEKRQFQPVENGAEGDASWWEAQVEDEQWTAACGPKDLSRVIDMFLSWAEGS